jgi:hypothetical protein
MEGGQHDSHEPAYKYKHDIGQHKGLFARGMNERDDNREGAPHKSYRQSGDTSHYKRKHDSNENKRY